MREVGKKYRFNYKDVQFDADKWADSKKFKPFAFDMVSVKAKRGEDYEVFNAWWTGYRWEGLRKKAIDTIVSWNKKAVAYE